MPVYDKNGQEYQYRGGGKPKIYYEVTKLDLARLFKVSIHTINSWIWNKKLDPYSLEDICNKYSNRHLIDGRRKG